MRLTSRLLMKSVKEERDQALASALKGAAPADEDPVAPEDTFAGLGRADPAALPAREAAPSPPDLEELAVGLDVDGFFDAN
ncbi:hypothetical protein PtrCC142_011367 [Pyrenophora tritici-repentis]|nr:hypothetical protein PtrCC142_011367 [Pyrenophora tritici-repentis]PWO19922.1 WD40 repeat containing protein [Pyrenophora tritici-repentis]